ncbi:MAG: stage II sporulation protein M, partial [Burkholderiaceae bacterium]|nr:stage II sporulation protein M [Burkholderiaceae bacterium]
MKQKQFELVHAVVWTQIEHILLDKPNADHAQTLPTLYRQLCQHLALALQRGYSPTLTDFLQHLVASCHQRLYGAQAARPMLLRQWMLIDFPQLVRAEWRLLLLAMGAFWGSALVVGTLIYLQPEWASSFMSVESLEQFRGMYRPGRSAFGRGNEGDLMMFGFYIWNNVSIGFRTVAGGVFAGIPALISLFFNGLHGGAVAGWLSTDAGTREVFWSFVITHASFEITGLILTGVAGMRLGLTWIHPGRLSRRHALMLASRRIFPLIVGATLLII